MTTKSFRYFFYVAVLLAALLSDHLGLWATEEGSDYPLEEALLLSKTLQLIKKNYVEPERINPDAMFEASLNFIQRSIPEVLAQCEKPKFCTVTVHNTKKRFEYPGDNLGNLRARLKEIFKFIGTNVDPDTEKKEIEYSAIDGILNELDPHTSFLSPEAYKEFQVGTEGEFGGLGIVISLKDGHLTVMSPLEDTPAWNAGIKPGDNVVEIDDESTINMTLTEAVQRLRGPVGSKVRLKIERAGFKSPLIKKLARAIINIEAVQSKLLATPKGNNIGFIRVKNFQANTERDFHLQLQQLMAKENNIKGVILDLRNNPGGLLDQAVTLSDEFLKEGTIVSTVGRNGKLIKRNFASDDGFEGNWPLIVLTNEGSASASEIVAGALKNNGRALLVGSKTFGKGSVQSVYRLPLVAALKITVAQYLTPGNESIQSVGIAPDIELIPIIVDKNHLDTIENILKTEKDLEKHFGKNEQTKESKSFYKLGYLAPPPEKEEELTKKEYTNKLQLEKDIDVDVALNLMDQFSKTERDAMLQEANTYLKSRQALEETKLAQKFEGLGLQWDVGAKGEKDPQAELSFNILKDGHKLKRAPAGETILLELELKNIGDAPFHRLVAQTESEEFLFKNIEFAFGKVGPKEKKSWTTKIEIPKATLTEEAKITLHFEETNHQAPPNVDLYVPIQALKRPLFAHQYTLEDQWSQKLKAGKPVQMKVFLTNIGEGTAIKPVISLKNLNGKELFIEKGRAALDPIDPGKTVQTDLRFHIDPLASADKINLELSIFDTELLISSKQKIALDLNSGKVSPDQNALYQPPLITLASADIKVDETPHLLQGEVKDDQAIRDLFIFVDEQKTFYESNASEGKSMRFNTPLNLKEGNNIIMITARDNFNLTSNHFFVLHYSLTPSKKKIADNKEKGL